MKFIIKGLSFFYPGKLLNNLKGFMRLIHSSYLSRKFKECGLNFRITPPYNLKGLHCISVGSNFWADKNLILQCWESYEGDIFQPKIILGHNIHFGENCHIGAINKIVLGDGLLTGRNIYITDHFHGHLDERDVGVLPITRELTSKGPVVIGENVWLGENVVIMPGVTIGSNVIIGANAVVTRDIPGNSVAAGVPAKVIRRLEK